MFPVLQIGSLALQLPGVILLAGIWLGMQLTEARAEKHGRDAEVLGNLVLFALLFGLLGARLGYVLRYPQAFLQHPGSLFSINTGLLDPWAGAVAAALTALVMAQRRQLQWWPTLDALTPLFASLALSLALSHFSSGQAYGAPTDLPWAIDLWGAPRHPSQLYEALAAVLILIILLRPGKPAAPAGILFLDFVSYSAAARLFLEAFRAGSHVLANGWRLEQVLAWLLLAAALWLRQTRLRRVPDPARAIQ